MNEERETGIGCMTAFVLIIVISLFAMCSCGSRKTITEYVSVHDTLIVTHSDTVSVDRWHIRHDTLRIETERIVTLLQPDKSVPAETVRIETNNRVTEKEVTNDSTSLMIAKMDSIKRALDAFHDRETEKTKNSIPWWGWLAIGGSAAFGCLGLLKSRVL